MSKFLATLPLLLTLTTLLDAGLHWVKLGDYTSSTPNPEKFAFDRTTKQHGPETPKKIAGDLETTKMKDLPEIIENPVKLNSDDHSELHDKGIHGRERSAGLVRKLGNRGMKWLRGVVGRHKKKGSLNPPVEQRSSANEKLKHLRHSKVQVKGARGPEGPKGIPGDLGTTGVKGLRGIVGHNGKKGLPGPKGDQGIPGNQGLNGPRGPKGFKGERGRDDEKGKIGPKGSPGPKGSHGKLGEMGARGPVGPPGDIIVVETAPLVEINVNAK